MPKQFAAGLAVFGTLALGGPLCFSVVTARANPAETPHVARRPRATRTADAFNGGTGEIRAMWMVRDSLTSPAKVRNAVALARKYGFNTIFVQVRGRGDAFYNSRFEPRSEELAEQPADFDPLALAIQEGHKAGLEVHAWMNTFLVWSKGRAPYSSRHVYNRHPDWLVRDKEGRAPARPTSDTEGAFLDSALPEVREYTKNVFLDVATRYNVDGIHFDYVRFPSERFSFSRASLAQFREYMLSQVSEADAKYADTKAAHNRLAWYYLYPHQWKTFRQSCVTATVRAIADEAHQLRPGLIVSAAVFPSYAVASQDKGQAWHEWLRDGILDAACPMTYAKDTGKFGLQVRDALANSWGKPIVPGVGAWQMPAASAIAKGQVCRTLGTGGMNFFSYDGMTQFGRTEAYLARVAGALFATPPQTPNWQRVAQPALAATVTEPDTTPVGPSPLGTESEEPVSGTPGERPSGG